MGQQLQQNAAADLVVYLTKDNAAVASLAFGDVVAEYLKEGDSAFTAKVLDALNWTEIGSGVYTIQFTAVELDTVGTFTVKVTGATIDQYVTISSVLAEGTTPTEVSLETCVLNGHVFGANGKAVVGAAISARVLGLPSIEGSVAAITDDLVAATTDANGEFFLSLVRGADVEIFIAAANYRRQLTVPNSAAANLFTGVT